MAKKPNYEELEQRIEEFENETTELKRLKEALRESEGKFRILSDQALLGIIILQEELFVYVNDRAAAIMEVTAEEVAAWSLGDYAKLIHPDDLAFVMEQGRKKQTGEKGAVTHYNWRMVTPGGNLKWIEMWSKTISFASRTADMVTMIDITERKLAEEALRESEEKFRHLVKNSNDVFVIIDENGKEIFVSDSVERITGFTPAETMEHSGFEFLHPDDVDHMSETLSKLLETPGKTIRDEYRHRRKEGGWVYLEAMGTNYLHEPLVGGIVLNIRDITNRKQAEEALRESEQKYRSLVESTDDSIYLVDRNYTYLFMNEQHLSRLGLQQDGFLGRIYGEFHSEDDTQEFAAMVEKVFETGRPIQQEHRSLKDNKHFLRTLSPVKESGGRTRAVTVVSKDITERVRSEKALLEREGRLRIQNQIANIFLTKSDEDMYEAILSVVLDIMESKFGVFGYIDQQGELVCPSMTKDIWDQCQLSDKTIVFPENTWGESIWENGLRTGTSAYSNKPFKVPEGHIPVERCLTVPLVYQEKSIGLFTVANKLTDYTESDKQTLEGIAGHVGPVLHERLEKWRANKALQESEEKLARSKKMESLGLLAGGVAHDLNNILSGIVTYPELLLMDLAEDSPLTRPIKTIQESGMRAVDVVADLLTIARGVATGREALNLNTIVTEYLASPECRELKRTHSFVDFKTELDSDLLNMSGSPTHIKKALMNLITNASEAIESSGTVTISTHNRYLDELLKGYEDVRQGEYVVLSVSDQGSGISPEDLERIFEPFYTKKVMGRSGTGLGLAVVWNTVQDHKGYINVTGSEQGTAFELYFPVSREKVAAKEEEVPLEDYLGHEERILVVDDEERQREIAGALLTKLGYAAESVSSGEEAMEYLKEHPVDLIVLDMVMPKGINGRETYEEIIKIRPGQKAIIASGLAKTKEVDMAQKLGAGMYIKKPYTLEKMGLAVKEELEK